MKRTHATVTEVMLTGRSWVFHPYGDHVLCIQWQDHRSNLPRERDRALYYFQLDDGNLDPYHTGIAAVRHHFPFGSRRLVGFDADNE